MREPSVTYYTYNAPGGHAWRSSAIWPLASEKRTTFWLGAGSLTPDAPAGGAHETRMNVRYDTDGEAFWESGMTFSTAPLPHDTEVTGHASATLWIASSSNDADIIARLDDVAPDGTHRYVGVEGKLRASLRATAKAPYETMGLPWHPFTKASEQPLVPGEPVEAQFEFLPTSYVFKAGHRIRLTLQFADARATAKADPAPVVTILHRADAPSHIELPVIPPAPDTPGTGRYPAVKEEVASLPEHVVYRPADLAALGSAKLGLYLFGNGGCSDDGASARMHLLEIASHGYLAVAPGRIRSGPGATAPSTAPPAGAPGMLSAPTRAADLLAALDWALAQNRDPASPYFGRIDERAVAVSGYSCGGLQALQIAADPRVKTLVVMNSGIFNDGAMHISGIDVSKTLLDGIHTPTLYVLGGETDIAYANGMDDVARIKGVPVFAANLVGVGHGGTYAEPNGGKAAAAVVAWLDWRLRGDARAARQFTGPDCGLCRDPAWRLVAK
jgi:dienelactone hydrolase